MLSVRVLSAKFAYSSLSLLPRRPDEEDEIVWPVQVAAFHQLTSLQAIARAVVAFLTKAKAGTAHPMLCRVLVDMRGIL